jgi:hypothetical protein
MIPFVESTWHISMDTTSPEAVPYFNWDAPVSNSELRRILREGTEADQLFWTARIMSEARYRDVWSYLSLRRDILPRWDRVRHRLGRRRAFWEFLIDRWRRDGLI